MATPVTFVTSGGAPVVSTPTLGAPVTPVASLGAPVTLVTGQGTPVTLVDDTGVVFESETVSLLGSMTVAPTTGRATQINTLIGALKTAGVWTKLDVLWILAAHDAQAARLNWKAPGTFTCNEVSSPTFTTDRGYAGDGVASYLNTTWAPGTHGVNYTQNSSTLIGWSRTSAQAANLLGNGTGTAAYYLIPRSAADQLNYRVNQASGTTAANLDGSGFYGASRSGANATQGYKNGATLGSAGAVASAALSTVAMNIGRVTSGFSAAQCSVAGAGGNLSGTEHAALYNALNAYMTAVGAA